MEQRTLKNVNNYLNIWIIWRFGMPERKQIQWEFCPKPTLLADICVKSKATIKSIRSNGTAHFKKCKQLFEYLNNLEIWNAWKKEDTMRILPMALTAKIGWYLCEI